MKCPRCQHENPPQAKFCLECGARVALTCTKCRSELPAGAKFCLECGEPVASQATGGPRFKSPQGYTPKHLAEKILLQRASSKASTAPKKLGRHLGSASTPSGRSRVAA